MERQTRQILTLDWTVGPQSPHRRAMPPSTALVSAKTPAGPHYSNLQDLNEQAPELS